ncbi:MAG: DUF1697 domain-containing protein [Solirubrobacterales bacterium]
MDRHVAFLRGMNLGNRRIKNEELRAEFERLGFENVETFRASGNVVFDIDDKESEAKLTARIEAGLGKALGYEVTVFLRGAAEVTAIAAREPFDAKAVKGSKGKLQVSLLLKKSSAATRKKALALATDEDLLAIEGCELYWLPSGGISESSLDLKAIEAAVGLDTRRTMGTIEQLATKYCS